MLLYVVVVFDPGYKMKNVAFCLRKLYYEYEVKTIMDSIESILGKLVHFCAANDSKRDNHQKINRVG